MDCISLWGLLEANVGPPPRLHMAVRETLAVCDLRASHRTCLSLTKVNTRATLTHCLHSDDLLSFSILYQKFHPWTQCQWLTSAHLWPVGVFPALYLWGLLTMKADRAPPPPPNASQKDLWERKAAPLVPWMKGGGGQVNTTGRPMSLADHELLS